MRRGVVRLAVVTGLAGGSALALRSHHVRRATRRGLEQMTRRARYQSGRLEGLRYRLAGRHPDPDVPSPVLADRIRSVLGPLEHRLDIPRVHVMVEDRTVLLHGEVDDERQAWAIEDAVRRVPGVARLRSHLAVGLTAGDSRPSQGASDHPSAALARVLEAAHAGGATRGSERGATRAALSTFVAQLPAEERRHLLGHLPADLRSLAAPPRPVTAGPRHLRRADELVAATGIDPTDPDRARSIVAAVLSTVHELVPEEARGVAAVLPADLRPLWEGAGALR